MLSVLPSHLPLLEHLLLSDCIQRDFLQVAHPNIRILELSFGPMSAYSEKRLRARMDEWLPKLERYIRHPTPRPVV
jgi:hypothetical protein